METKIIFEPKSWSQTNKFDLVFLKLKNRKPLYLLGISDFSRLGARWDSNPRHSEPQAITRIFSKPLCTSLFPRTEKTVFAAILRLFVFRAEICKVVPFLDFMFFNYDL